jgi:tetratricopeptide (TPR) repeat protein
LTNGDGEKALRLVGALWPFWLERGYLTEGRRWLAAALALDGGGRVQALIGAARLSIEQSDFVEANARAEQAVAVARSASARDLAKALNVRGNLARTQSRYADAIRDHEGALSILDGAPSSISGDTPQRASIMLDLSYDEFAVGNSDKARELAERVLEAMRELGDMRGIGNALAALAWQKQKYDLEGAEAVAREALNIFETLNDPGRVAEILRQLGTIAQFEGRFESSLQLFERAHQLYSDRGDERTAAQLLSHMSHAASGLGDAESAQSLARESLRIARAFNDRWAIAISTTQLGHLELGEHRLDPARAYFSESARIFQEIGNPIYLSWCVEGLAAVAVADGRTEIAAKLCAAREALLERLGSRLPPMVPDAYAKTLAAAGKSATVEPLPDLIVQSLNG